MAFSCSARRRASVVLPGIAGAASIRALMSVWPRTVDGCFVWAEVVTALDAISARASRLEIRFMGILLYDLPRCGGLLSRGEAGLALTYIARKNSAEWLREFELRLEFCQRPHSEGEPYSQQRGCGKEEP